MRQRNPHLATLIVRSRETDDADSTHNHPGGLYLERAREEYASAYGDAAVADGTVPWGAVLLRAHEIRRAMLGRRA